MARTSPRRDMIYSLREVYGLALDDTPALLFTYKSIPSTVQTGHVSKDQLLSVPGFAETLWRYTHTTHEWVPVFRWVLGQAKPIEEFLDIKLPSGWATPKGFPRKEDE